MNNMSIMIFRFKTWQEESIVHVVAVISVSVMELKLVMVVFASTHVVFFINLSVMTMITSSPAKEILHRIHIFSV